MKKKVIIHYPLLIFLITNVLSFLLLYYFYKNDFSNYVLFKTLIFIGLLWIPFLIEKGIKTKVPKFIFQLYFVIIVIDLFLGKILMFERLIGIYNYLTLFIQGIIFYVFGLWVIKFLDDYGFFSYKVVIIFSLLFGTFLNVIREIFYYFIERMFNIQGINHILYLFISLLGTISIFVLSIIDNQYYKNKYFRLLDKEI